MGVYSDLMGFHSDLMGYEWDVPPSKLTAIEAMALELA